MTPGEHEASAPAEFSRYLSGELLYGDDFAPEQIAAWYEDEKEGYADLGRRDHDAYFYSYHGLNIWHVYRHLPPVRFPRVLGFGSAYGHEFAPIASRIDRLSIVDPSDAFVSRDVYGIPTEYVKPHVSGKLPFQSDVFDLITCFGVLHHLPNVSYIFGELARVLKPGGFLAIREPIISLGDWRHARPGLTKRERGIPLHVLHRLSSTHRLSLASEGLCIFPLTSRFFQSLFHGFNQPTAARFDSFACHLFQWNLRYHARTLFQKFRPTSAYLLIRK